eukprot:2967637-Rhodomonas_salina.2
MQLRRHFEAERALRVHLRRRRKEARHRRVEPHRKRQALPVLVGRPGEDLAGDVEQGLWPGRLERGDHGAERQGRRVVDLRDRHRHVLDLTDLAVAFLEADPEQSEAAAVRVEHEPHGAFQVEVRALDEEECCVVLNDQERQLLVALVLGQRRQVAQHSVQDLFNQSALLEQHDVALQHGPLLRVRDVSAEELGSAVVDELHKDLVRAVVVDLRVELQRAVLGGDVELREKQARVEHRVQRHHLRQHKRQRLACLVRVPRVDAGREVGEHLHPCVLRNLDRALHEAEARRRVVNLHNELKHAGLRLALVAARRICGPIVHEDKLKGCGSGDARRRFPHDAPLPLLKTVRVGSERHDREVRRGEKEVGGRGVELQLVGEHKRDALVELVVRARRHHARKDQRLHGLVPPAVDLRDNFVGWRVVDGLYDDAQRPRRRRCALAVEQRDVEVRGPKLHLCQRELQLALGRDARARHEQQLVVRPRRLDHEGHVLALGRRHGGAIGDRSGREGATLQLATVQAADHGGIAHLAADEVLAVLDVAAPLDGARVREALDEARTLRLSGARDGEGLLRKDAAHGQAARLLHPLASPVQLHQRLVRPARHPDVLARC